MEIIKFNEIKTRRKHLLSLSIYKMLDTYRPFEVYFDSFKKIISELSTKQTIFDIRVYFDYSCHKEIEPFIKEYPLIEFYKFNFPRLRISEYHHGVFGKLIGYYPIFQDYFNYEYIYVTDVLFEYKWYRFNDINFVLDNKINTYFYLLPKGEEKNKISLPLLTNIKINKLIFDSYITSIANGKYNDYIHKMLSEAKYSVTYNYDVKFPYGMDIYFINNIVYDNLYSGSVYARISYDLLRFISLLFKANYTKIYNLPKRSKDILEEIKKLSEIKFNSDDNTIKGTIISLIVKFINKYGRDDFLKLFYENQQKVIALFYIFIDKNKEKVNNDTLYELSELIKLK